jgi:hypothetical protein
MGALRDFLRDNLGSVSRTEADTYTGMLRNAEGETVEEFRVREKMAERLPARVRRQIESETDW